MAGKLRAKLVAALACFLFFMALGAATIEISERVRYARWRASYDNGGWLNAVTIPSPDPVLLWEYRPDARKVFPDGYEIVTNHYGFVDEPDITLPKPVDRARVAIVGDSVTMGMGVNIRETFGKALERAFNARSETKLQVLTFGIDGYNARQVGEMMRTKVLAFRPDVVVYALCMNDFDFTTDESNGEKMHFFNKPNSFFLDVLRHAAQALRRTEFHRYHFAQNRDAVFAEIASMRQAAEDHGARFLVAILPVFPKDATFDAYPLRDLHQQIMAFLRAQGIAGIDLLQSFQKAGRPPRDWAGDIWHPTVEGHAFIGQALVDPITAQLATQD
jgi:lysophospholipase L1-like esterase